MSSIWQDLRYGARQLARNPGFTAVAVLTLALGIGANTAIFSVVNALFLRPLPVEDPARLVSVFTFDHNNPGHLPSSTHNFRDLRDQSDVFSGVVAFGFLPVAISSQGEEPEQLPAFAVSGNYFDVLGVRMKLGRSFLPEEDSTPGGHPVAILSHTLWQRRFGGDPSIVGRTVSLNGRPFTVVGVGPEGFRGTFTLFGPELWVPFSMYDTLQPGTPWYDSRRWRWLNIVARLKPGTSLEHARAATTTLARQLELQYPDANTGRTLSVLPLLEAALGPNERGDYVRTGWLLSVVVGLVLLIGCTNLANLLLARGCARQKEIGIRLALGAGRGRLIRQLLTESLLLALLGGTLALLVANWGQDLLWAYRPPFLAQTPLEFSLDARVLTYTLAISVLTGLLFGLLPAVQATRLQLQDSLKEGGRQSGAGARSPVRRMLILVEVALCSVALLGAGLFLRSLWKAQNIDPGFESRELLVMTLNLDSLGYTAAAGQVFQQRLLEEVEALPGVQAAGLAVRAPLSPGGITRTITIESKEPPPDGLGYAVPTNAVTPSYFAVMGIPIMAGRGFTEEDRPGVPNVAIINEAMARRFWPGEDPLGRHVNHPLADLRFQVVGIARDSKYITMGEAPQPFFYVPLRQHYTANVNLHVRVAGAPQSPLPSVLAKIRSLDPGLPVANPVPVSELLRQALWAPRMGAAMLGVFAALALLLASVGIYGVIAYMVTQRTHEIGVRLALGAQPGDILRLIVGGATWPALAGIGIGIAAALAAGKLIANLLYGVNPADPLVIFAVSALMVAVALLASYLPARRAMRVDPMTALRYE